MKIGEKIKLRRNELGWSQRDLAEKMGYDNHSTIARIEVGKIDIPQSRIVQFAEVLGTDIAYLMDLEEEMAQTESSNMNEFYNRIMKLCEMRGIKGAKMCADIGVSKSLLTDMKMGRKNGVSAVNAQKIASYFGVSVAYLLGEAEHVAEISYTQAIDKLAKLFEDKEFCELFESYSRLNAKNKQIVKRLITDLSV